MFMSLLWAMVISTVVFQLIVIDPKVHEEDTQIWN